MLHGPVRTSPNASDMKWRVAQISTDAFNVGTDMKW
jgi:hypothetical protein